MDHQYFKYMANSFPKYYSFRIIFINFNLTSLYSYFITNSIICIITILGSFLFIVQILFHQKYRYFYCHHSYLFYSYIHLSNFILFFLKLFQNSSLCFFSFNPSFNNHYLYLIINLNYLFHSNNISYQNPLAFKIFLILFKYCFFIVINF